MRDVISLVSDLLPLTDVLALLLAGYLSTLLYAGALPAGAWALFSPAVLGAALIGPFILYDKSFGALAKQARAASVLMRNHSLRFSVLAVVILTFDMLNPAVKLPMTWLILLGVASFLLTSMSRLVLAIQIRRLERHGVLRETIAVVGAGPIADRLIQQLQKSSAQNVDLIGVFDDKLLGASVGSIPRTGSVAELIELGKSRKIDWIIMTLPCTAEDRLRSIVQRLKGLSIPIGLCPENVGLTLPCHHIDYVGENVPVTLLADRPIQRWGVIIKNAEDLILGSLITLMLLPVMALIALAIRIDSPGPIFFKQKRHAFNNSEFEIYKFRSMRWAPVETGELKQTTRNDERFTRLGRLLRASSLDELPQLFNVLRGEMSLVGPRPHAVNMRTEDRLGTEIIDVYAHRHRVKPGITGWSQVNGARGATDTVEQLRRRIELDLYYVENWSFLFDIKILFLTVREVIKKTNAY